MREAGFFILFFISSKTDEGDRFVFLFPQKQTKHVFYMSCYTLRQCSMVGVLHVQPLMIFRPIQKPFWTLNQAIFLKNRPSQLHDGRRHYKERCDACIPTPNHIKNQYQAPTRFSEDRVNVQGILNVGRTWTKRNNIFLMRNFSFFFFWV